MPATATLLLLLATAGYGQAWRYAESEKPEGWAGTCTDGKMQSPIDLLTENAERFVVEPLEFFNFKSLNGTVTNNGHSIAIHFDEDHCDTGVTAGMLRSIYILQELHFHWDSEHTIDGRRYPLELHMVHYNQKYSSLKHAAHQHDGLAVIGVLFHDAENGTDIVDDLLETVQSVSSTVQATVRLPPKFNPEEFLPEDKTTFFRYSGSLTTPPCSETVTWTVLTSTVPVSKEQMKIFKLVNTEKGVLEHNYRRLQDINDRIVYLLSDNGAASVNSFFALILCGLLVVYRYN